jgi:hypothetical protein
MLTFIIVYCFFFEIRPVTSLCSWFGISATAGHGIPTDFLELQSRHQLGRDLGRVQAPCMVQWRVLYRIPKLEVFTVPD